MKLAEIIAQYRQEHGLSQREFARQCGLSNSLISIFEMGKNPQTGKEISPDLETYRKLADGMGISVKTLLAKINEGTPANAMNWLWGYNNTDNQSVTADTADNLSKEDLARLEALHQDPRLGLLFDRTRKMSHADVETMLAVAASILKERDGDD